MGAKASIITISSSSSSNTGIAITTGVHMCHNAGQMRMVLITQLSGVVRGARPLTEAAVSIHVTLCHLRRSATLVWPAVASSSAVGGASWATVEEQELP